MEQNTASWSDWLVLKSWHERHLELLKSQGYPHNLSVSAMTDRNSKCTEEDKKKLVFGVGMEFIR